MITETDILNEFNLISSAGWGRISTFHHWDKTSRSFRLKKKTFLFSSLMNALIAGSLIGSVLHVILFHGKLYNMPYDSSKLAFLFILGISCGTDSYISLVHYWESPSFGNLMEQLVKFEDRYIHFEETSWKIQLEGRNMTRLALLLCRGSRLATATILAPLFAMSSVIVPNFPLNILKFYPLRLTLIETGDLCGWGWLLGKGWAFIVNYIVIVWHYPAKIWCVLMAEIGTSCISLTAGLLQFEREIRKGSLETGLLMHRQLSYLLKLFNELESTILILSIVLAVNCQIIIGFKLLRSYQSLTIFEKLFDLIGLLNAMAVVTLVLGFCGEVHNSSLKCTKHISKYAAIVVGIGESGSATAKLLRRVIKSFPVSKVEFGGGNFIERLTPAVVEQFTVGRLIDSLLVSNP